MFNYLIIYEDESTEVRNADTIQDVLFQISSTYKIHSVIRLGDC